MRTAVDHTTFQIMSSLSWQLVIVFPDPYNGVDGLLGVTKFSFGSDSKVMPVGCMTTTYDALDSMVVSTVGPVALSVVVMLCAFLRGGSDDKKTKNIQRHIGHVITIAFLTLPAACTAIFRTFHCRSFDEIDEQYLVVDYSVECGTTRHNAHRGLALFFVFIYVRPGLLFLFVFAHLLARDNAQ